MARTSLVSVILDPEFGSRLEQVAARGAVWIVDSPHNRTATKKHWADYPDHDHLEGVTLFQASRSLTPEEILIVHVDTIDLHHGPYSANPPYRILDVFGVAFTPAVEATLRAFDFIEFQDIQDGFRAFLAETSQERLADV